MHIDGSQKHQILLGIILIELIFIYTDVELFH